MIYTRGEPATPDLTVWSALPSDQGLASGEYLFQWRVSTNDFSFISTGTLDSLIDGWFSVSNLEAWLDGGDRFDITGVEMDTDTGDIYVRANLTAGTSTQVNEVGLVDSAGNPMQVSSAGVVDIGWIVAAIIAALASLGLVAAHLLTVYGKYTGNPGISAPDDSGSAGSSGYIGSALSLLGIANPSDTTIILVTAVIVLFIIVAVYLYIEK